MDEITEELVYEYWDCDKCGKKEIRGDIRTCVGCGSPRNEAIQFYRLEKKEEIISDTILKEKFTAGADWSCSFCSTLNAIVEPSCTSCGASKETSELNYFEVQEKKKLKAEKIQPAIAEHSQTNWKKISLWVSSIFTSLIAGICLLTNTHDVEFKVTNLHWEKTIPVMRNTRSEKTDWSNELKGETIERLSSSNQIRAYEDRQVGTRNESYTESESYQSGSRKECSTSYESTGSGASKKKTSCSQVPTYSNRSVNKTRTVPVFQKFPIYDSKIVYKSNMYVLLKNYTATGSDNNPKAPEFVLGTGENGKADITGDPLSIFKVTLKKNKSEDKALEIQKLKVSEEIFKSKYILNSNIKLPVDIFQKISPADGEEILQDAP